MRFNVNLLLLCLLKQRLRNDDEEIDSEGAERLSTDANIDINKNHSFIKRHNSSTY